MFAAIIETIKEWQELVAGILALIAGAFIFVQGRLERDAIDATRQKDVEKARQTTRDILQRLSAACKKLMAELENSREIVADVVRAIDNGEKFDPPPRVPIPQIFSVIFAQLTTQPIPIEIYVMLSTLLDKGTAMDDDFRRFFIAYSGTISQHNFNQERLPFPSARLVSEEPVVQALYMSIDGLFEVVEELQTKIDLHLDGIWIPST